MERELATSISDGFMQFLKTCLEGLLTFEGTLWGHGFIPAVQLELAVDTSLLCFPESPETNVRITHEGTCFLVLVPSRAESGIASRAFPGGLRPRTADEDLFWPDPCPVGGLAEVIRLALEKHLEWKLSKERSGLARLQALLEKLKGSKAE